MFDEQPNSLDLIFGPLAILRALVILNEVKDLARYPAR
jgi:hypothetical protein